jgi:PAS domain S-box-containing protein
MAITRHDDKGTGVPFRHTEQPAVLREGERGLRASEEHLQRSLEAAGVGHWDYDYVNDTLVWSEHTRKLLGVEPCEPASRTLLRSRVHPEDRPRLEEHIARSANLDADHTRHFEFRVVMPNGSIRWLEDQDWVETSTAGMPVRAIGVLRDVTARKNAEEAQSRLAAIVTSSADAIVGKTLDGIVTSWNEAAERMFGYSAGEMIGQSIRCLIPADRQAEEDMILTSLARSESIAHFETKRVTKDGRTFDASVTVSPVRDAEGRVIGAAKIIRDISERMQAEAQTAADLRAMTTLREIGNLYVRNDLQTAECLQRTIDAAIAIVGADKGTLQVFDVSSNSRVIAAHCGFAEPFLTFFKHVNNDASACAAAMQTKGQVVVEDILHSDIFVGQKSQAVLIGAGVRAVVCTPLMSSNGTLVGMVSTHYANPHRPTDREIYLIEVLARQAADYLERKRAEQLQKTLLSELNHRCNKPAFCRASGCKPEPV